MAKYDMHLKCTPTPANLQAAAELAPGLVAELSEALGEAQLPLYELTQRDTPPSAVELVDAIATLRAEAERIRRLEYKVLGVAVLGGAAVTTTARAIGVRPSTLSDNLAGTRAQGRGKPMTKLDNGTWVNA